MTMRLIVTLSLLALTLMACGRAETPTTDVPKDTPTSERPASQSPLSPLLTPTPAPLEQTSPLPDPSSSPIETPPGTVDDVMAAAEEYLARELSITSERVEITTIVPVEWSDAGLGCPEPGQSYAQVITPGYRIVAEVKGKQYELHTDRQATNIRICPRELERGPAAAVAHLADELGIPEDEIEVLSVEKYEWPDASLGCPEPGRSYAQVVTPGYRVILRAEGEEYEVRTDDDGRITVLCDRGS